MEEMSDSKNVSSSVQGGIQITPEEAELPDMIPVTIKTTLPEFQHISPIERVLAGVLLTWKEFLQLFDSEIKVESSDYIVRGSNGSVMDLDAKIKDYVDTFKRRLKIYTVSLEHAHSPPPMPKGHRMSTHSESSSGKHGAGAGDNRSKRPKLTDEEKGKRNHRKMTKESLEKIAQTVIQGQSAAAAATNAKRPKKTDNKRASVKSKSRSPTPSAIGTDVATTSKTALQGGSPGTSGKLKRLSGEHSQTKEINASSAAPPAKRGRKPRKSRTLSSRRTTKESNNTVVESNEDESSDSDDEGASKEKKRLLKQNVIQYLSDKVSPRSFLRLRNELMALREQEKYFKVTTVVPITAGMMEQAFCRKLTE